MNGLLGAGFPNVNYFEVAPSSSPLLARPPRNGGFCFALEIA
jgi:hypothetical protein